MLWLDRRAHARTGPEGLVKYKVSNKKKRRVTRFERATFSLATRCSTTELYPLLIR
jgi:hypothetical protein